MVIRQLIHDCFEAEAVQDEIPKILSLLNLVLTDRHGFIFSTARLEIKAGKYRICFGCCLSGARTFAQWRNDNNVELIWLPID